MFIGTTEDGIKTINAETGYKLHDPIGDPDNYASYRMIPPFYTLERCQSIFEEVLISNIPDEGIIINAVTPTVEEA